MPPKQAPNSDSASSLSPDAKHANDLIKKAAQEALGSYSLRDKLKGPFGDKYDRFETWLKLKRYNITKTDAFAKIDDFFGKGIIFDSSQAKVKAKNDAVSIILKHCLFLKIKEKGVYGLSAEELEVSKKIDCLVPGIIGLTNFYAAHIRPFLTKYPQGSQENHLQQNHESEVKDEASLKPKKKKKK